MDTMENKIRDDKHFMQVMYAVVNNVLPELVENLMNWKKPHEIPEDIAQSIARVCAISFHLHEYLEDRLPEDDDEQPNLLN
jgi:hypothetical protein